MSSLESVTAVMCVDCALILANDDDSGMTESEGLAHRDRMSSHIYTYWIGVRLDTFVVGDAGAHFSSHPCEICGEQSHGDRIEGVALIRT